MGIGLIGSTVTNRWYAKHKYPAGWGKTAARGDFRVSSNRDGTVACVIWKDKGTVRLTCTVGTTARDECMRGSAGRPRHPLRCPYVALLFMRYFHGVDRQDQMRAKHYSLSDLQVPEMACEVFHGYV